MWYFIELVLIHWVAGVMGLSLEFWIVVAVAALYFIVRRTLDA